MNIGQYLFPNATAHTLQEEKFHRNLNFAISLMANSLKLIFAYHYTFRNLTMIAHIIEIKNQNSLIFNSVNMVNL